MLLVFPLYNSFKLTQVHLFGTDGALLAIANIIKKFLATYLHFSKIIATDHAQSVKTLEIQINFVEERLYNGTTHLGTHSVLSCLYYLHKPRILPLRSRQPAPVLCWVTESKNKFRPVKQLALNNLAGDKQS